MDVVVSIPRKPPQRVSQTKHEAARRTGSRLAAAEDTQGYVPRQQPDCGSRAILNLESSLTTLLVGFESLRPRSGCTGIVRSQGAETGSARGCTPGKGQAGLSVLRCVGWGGCANSEVLHCEGGSFGGASPVGGGLCAAC